MPWRQFVMDLENLAPEAVETLFQRHGAQAVTLSDAGDDPVLEPLRGETPLWNRTRITGLFAADADFCALVDDLARAFDLREPPLHRIEDLADRPWEREWLRDFGPLCFGRRLWVCPVGQRPADEQAVVVDLDPGLAFGTGTHPTTALCLRWLDSASLEGCRVLDFGCGSDILGIAALKLGAAAVVAVDIDPQAVAATRSNADSNRVADRLQAGTSLPDERFDVVLANVLASPLIAESERLADRLAVGASLVLSGILRSQEDSVRAAYAGRVLFAPALYAEDWVRLDGRRP